VAKKAAKLPRAGQRVEWDSSGGTSEGVVERVVRAPVRVKGYVAKASPDHPEVLVKSAKTGAEAVHLPSELRPGKPAKRTKKKG
jgi:Hypervirulence associated proteins TUDOR domain